ncbi:MAG TPA: hypothetical protein VLB82_01295 [Thermodesulfobacteriota bacterium]|nr:hypothetical protein [Thermodesulfobacteriota bacterium]
MNLETYLEEIKQFAVYPKKHELEYLKLGLLSEIGEVAGVLKKGLRGDYCQFVEVEKPVSVCVRFVGVGEGEFGTLYRGAGDEPFKQDLTKEIGDCFWYWGMLVHYYKEDINSYGTWDTYADPCADYTTDTEVVESLITGCNLGTQNILLEPMLFELQILGLRHNLDLETILQTNIDKLTDRKNRNKIKGSGDER